MEFDRKQLKYEARQAMALPRPRFWVVTLVYVLMTTGLATVIDMVLPTHIEGTSPLGALTLFLSLLTMLYTTVVGFGYTLWSLWTMRRLQSGLGALIEGFSVAGRVIWMKLLIIARALLWSLPMVFALSMVIISMPFLTTMGLAVMMLAVYGAIWAILLRYAMAPFLLADRPDDGAGVAVRRSELMMRGNKWQLFKLEFSFIGWELLGVALVGGVLSVFLWQAGFFPLLLNGSPTQVYEMYLTVSQGALASVLTALISLPLTLWLMPYRSVALAGFYDALLQQQKQTVPPLPPL